MTEIDIVILWVDGSDPEWIREYNRSAPSGSKKEVQVRFRDWDNLHYVFRGFEKFAPWIRTVHLVTWGHLPKWVNVSHPKLNIVKHHDFLDVQNLPVFNANAIEINIHRIQELSEYFIFFNDDFFLTRPMESSRFFQDGLPRDTLISNALSSSSGVGHFVLNNLEILNRHFEKYANIKRNFLRWFHPSYGIAMLRNVCLLPWPRFTGFIDHHMPQPFLKSTFEEIWNMESEMLEQTSQSKFRNCQDTNQYLFRYWQFAKGTFIPVSIKDTRYVTLTMERLRSGEISRLITSQQYCMICLNDSDTIETEEAFEEAKRIVNAAFEQILPEKSGFEL